MSPAPERSRIELLASVPVFASLPDKLRARIAAAASERPFAAGEKLVSQGEKGIGFFLLLNGQVDVRANGKTIATLGPSEFFGEMALLDEQPRTADVVGVQAGRCLVLSRWEFWGFLAKEPDSIRVLLQETVRRLRAPGRSFSE